MQELDQKTLLNEFMSSMANTVESPPIEVPKQTSNIAGIATLLEDVVYAILKSDTITSDQLRLLEVLLPYVDIEQLR